MPSRKEGCRHRRASFRTFSVHFLSDYHLTQTSLSWVLEKTDEDPFIDYQVYRNKNVELFLGSKRKINRSGPRDAMKMR